MTSFEPRETDLGFQVVSGREAWQHRRCGVNWKSLFHGVWRSNGKPGGDFGSGDEETDENSLAAYFGQATPGFGVTVKQDCKDC